MKCIIVEDQAPAQRILQHYIKQVEFLDLIKILADPIDAMTYVNEHQVDLMFLDIHLPKISGINLLKTMRNPPHVILTTAYDNYALESYDLDVVDYLLKPFSLERFLKAVNKVSNKKDNTFHNKIDESKEEHIYIKSGHEHIKVLMSDIQYIKADSDYTEVCTHKHKHLSTETLKHWANTLDSPFYRVHRSYIINTDHIIKVRGTSIELKNITIPIGRAYKSDFYRDFLGE